MAEHNTSIAVGAAQSFGASYAPRRTNITTTTGNWSYGYGSYPAAYRSFSQNLINSNFILGPYARRLDGVAGRIKISTQAAFGELGFAQQCWYDWPRGSNDKVNGVLQETNKVWWDTEVSGKYWIRVYNLNDDNAPLIWVQVAIDGGGGTNPPLSMHDPSNGPLQGECIKHIRAGHNFYGGQANWAELYTGIAGNCGIKSDTLSSLAIPYSASEGGWLPDVSFLENGAFAGLGWCLAGDGEAATEAGNIYNGLNGTQQASAGATFSNANRANNFAANLATHLANVKDFLSKLNNFLNANANGSASERNNTIDDVLEIFAAVPFAGALMNNGWFLPNLRKHGNNPNNLPTGVAGNAHVLYPPDKIQQRWASQMKTDSDGSPNTSGQYNSQSQNVNYGDFRDYIPAITPNRSDTGSKDWAWFLTHLNRGDTTSVPYVDEDTNEFVWNESYGFGRGGSVEEADPFLDWIEAKTDQQTANSLGVLVDMSPGAQFFVAGVIPIAILEAGGRMIKSKKGESIGATNLDGYDTTTFETRISAENMKAGNAAMYNYLVNTGDANGKKFTAVP